jgi:hypothetical protein
MKGNLTQAVTILSWMGGSACEGSHRGMFSKSKNGIEKECYTLLRSHAYHE